MKTDVRIFFLSFFLGGGRDGGGREAGFPFGLPCHPAGAGKQRASGKLRLAECQLEDVRERQAMCLWRMGKAGRGGRLGWRGGGRGWLGGGGDGWGILGGMALEGACLWGFEVKESFGSWLLFVEDTLLGGLRAMSKVPCSWVPCAGC